jgi:hypothetical protein
VGVAGSSVPVGLISALVGITSAGVELHPSCEDVNSTTDEMVEQKSLRVMDSSFNMRF